MFKNHQKLCMDTGIRAVCEGRSIRRVSTFSIRVTEHINLIKSGSIKHTVPQHYRQHHDHNPTGTQFLIIDRYIAPWRGGATKRGVSRLETFWIYELRTHYPQGMNVEWDINLFINQS